MDTSKIRLLTEPAVDLPKFINVDRNCTVEQFSNIIGASIGYNPEVYVAIPVESTQRLSDVLKENKDAFLVGGNIQKESSGFLRFLIYFPKQQIRTVADFPIESTVNDIYLRYKLTNNDIVSSNDQKLFNNTLLKDIYSKSNFITIISDMGQSGTIARNVISRDGKIHTIYVCNDSTLADVARKYVEVNGIPPNHNPVFIYTQPEAGASPIRVSIFTKVSQLDPNGRLIISFGPKKATIPEQKPMQAPIDINDKPLKHIQKVEVHTKDPNPETVQERVDQQKSEAADNTPEKSNTTKIRVLIKGMNEDQPFHIDIPSDLKCNQLGGYLRNLYGDRITDGIMKIKVGIKQIDKISDPVCKVSNNGNSTINVNFLRVRQREKHFTGTPISFKIKVDSQGEEFEFEGKSDMTLADLANELRKTRNDIKPNCTFRGALNYINNNTPLGKIDGNLILIFNPK